jgi:hypothetical protein
MLSQQSHALCLKRKRLSPVCCLARKQAKTSQSCTTLDAATVAVSSHDSSSEVLVSETIVDKFSTTLQCDESPVTTEIPTLQTPQSQNSDEEIEFILSGCGGGGGGGGGEHDVNKVPNLSPPSPSAQTLATALGCILARLYGHGDLLPAGVLPISDYVNHLVRLLDPSAEAVVLTYRYISNLHFKDPLSGNTIHTTFLGALRLATKFWDDTHFDNRSFAAAGGMNVKDLNRMELDMLIELDYFLSGLQAAESEHASVIHSLTRKDYHVGCACGG